MAKISVADAKAKREGPVKKNHREEDRGHLTFCWIWQGRTIKRGGYGITYVARRGTVLAHVAYFEEANGAVPGGLVLDHVCRVSACVNPAHLEPVTQAENVRRGRNTKFSDQEINSLRLLWATGKYTQTQLASAYGMSSAHISCILRGVSRSEAKPYRKPWSVGRVGQ